MAQSNPPVEPGASQALTDVPAHDASEAGEAAASPTDDPRRPRLIPGLAGDPMTLEMIRDHVTSRFPDVVGEITHGELTLHVKAEQLPDVVAFARDDEQLDCRSLADLSGVHWPAGEHIIERQPSTTGWPEYRVSRERDRGALHPAVAGPQPLVPDWACPTTRR